MARSRYNGKNCIWGLVACLAEKFGGDICIILGMNRVAMAQNGLNFGKMELEGPGRLWDTSRSSGMA